MRRRPLVLALASGALATATLVQAFGSFENTDFPYIDVANPAIQYAELATDDPITRLQGRIDRGEVVLDYDPKFGYLLSLLKNLGISTDSQMLVFSKRSFQRDKISPRAPRALFFTDNAAVGVVQHGEVLELASLDSKQGVIFYTLDVDRVKKPTFTRRDSGCLPCHMIPGTLNVPGLLTTSGVVGPDGTERFPGGDVMVDGRIPISERWGGWYVTGTTGSVQHQANVIAADVPDRRESRNLLSLKGRFDEIDYVQPMSDVVALLTLEHQTRMTNLLIRLGWEARTAAEAPETEQSKARLRAVVDEIVSYMLFADEAKIHEPITGVSSFTASFAARGPRDKQGRSLREFDLRKRLFRFPLSYMIYSEAFDALPASARALVYERLYNVLSGKDPGGEFASLSVDDRRAVLEIVRDTKSSIPDYWKACCN